ncbi:unnamed protein product [Closterium sp. Yama58-4]|nr:unnamed protein product [Closterium sp. Yama58-4]
MASGFVSAINGRPPPARINTRSSSRRGSPRRDDDRIFTSGRDRSRSPRNESRGGVTALDLIGAANRGTNRRNEDRAPTSPTGARNNLPREPASATDAGAGTRNVGTPAPRANRNEEGPPGFINQVNPPLATVSAQGRVPGQQQRHAQVEQGPAPQAPQAPQGHASVRGRHVREEHTPRAPAAPERVANLSPGENSRRPVQQNLDKIGTARAAARSDFAAMLGNLDHSTQANLL